MWLAVETSAIYFAYPETKGPSLEEVAVVLEGSDAKVGAVDGVADKVAAIEHVEKA